MAYILLVGGILIGIFALYKFMRRASKQETKTLLLSLAIGMTLLMIFVLVISGRLPLAAILAAILVPLIAALFKSMRAEKSNKQ